MADCKKDLKAYVENNTGTFVEQAMCSALGKSTLQQGKFEVKKAQLDRKVMEVKMEVAEVHNHVTDLKRSVAQLQATMDAFVARPQPAVASSSASRGQGSGTQCPNYHDFGPAATRGAQWGRLIHFPHLVHKAHMKKVYPPLIQKYVGADLVGRCVPKYPPGGTKFGVKLPTRQAAADFLDSFREEPLNYPLNYPGPDGSVVVFACGPPMSDAAEARGRALRPIFVELDQAPYKGHCMPLWGRGGRPNVTIHAKCDDGSLFPLVKDTCKDDVEQAHIVELWVAEKLRDPAKVAKIEEAAGFGIEPEVPQAQS